jgi:hypothetical protein
MFVGGHHFHEKSLPVEVKGIRTYMGRVSLFVNGLAIVKGSEKSVVGYFESNRAFRRSGNLLSLHTP